MRRSNQALGGAGAATVLRLTDDADCPVIIMGEPVNQPRRTISHLEAIGLFIDGNRFHQGRELWLGSARGTQIHNNGITVQGVNDSVVKKVACARCRPLAQSECTNNVFTYLHAANCGSPAFHVNDSSCVNNVVANINVGANLKKGISAGTHPSF